jgi:hypothetical protein
VSPHEYRSSGLFPTRPMGHRCCPIVRVLSDLGLGSMSVCLRQAVALGRELGQERV